MAANNARGGAAFVAEFPLAATAGTRPAAA